MIIAHHASDPHPPSRSGLIIGPGGTYTDDGGQEWCGHASDLLDLGDVGRQRAETERARAGRGGRAPAGRAQELRPQPDTDGRLPDIDGLRWTVEGMRP